MDPTRSAALGGPRERRFVGPAAGPHGGAHAFCRPHGGHPSAHSPRAPCSSSTDALAWPKPDLSPPTDVDGDGILALFAPGGGGAHGGPHALGGPRRPSGAALRRPGGGATWWRPRVLAASGWEPFGSFSPVRPARPLLTRLLGPDLTSLPRQVLTVAASLRFSRLQQAPLEKAQVAGCRS